MPLTITFDLEDNRCSAAQEERFIPMTLRFVEFLEQRNIVGTFFIVGELAHSHPDLVRQVAQRGHEIGLHGLRHVALGEVGPERLQAELEEGRGLLEEIVGCRVRGFRAPIFSLTPVTAWAVECISKAGFTYSSSVLPAASPLHGWPGAPRVPFRWDTGLLELPCPVGGIGRACVPFLGGVYLRFVPMTLVRRFLRDLDTRVVTWSYSHPYDIDPDEPFFVMPYAGWLTSRIVHMRRRATLKALDGRIAAGAGAGRPLAEIAESLAGQDLPLVRSR